MPRAYSVIALALAVTAFAGFYSARHLGIDTDTANMISESLPWRQDFIALKSAFPDLADNLVVVIDGPTPEARADAQAALASTLQGNAAFRSVRAPGSEDWFRKNGLLFLEADALAARVDRLAEVQPLLARLHRDPGLAELSRLIGEALERGDYERLEPIVDALTDALNAETGGGDYRVSWQQLMQPGDESGEQKPLLLLRPERGERAFGYAAHAIRTVRSAAASMAPDGVSVKLTGPVAMEYEELLSVASGALLAGLLALAMVAVVLWIALRSIRLLFACVVTLVCGLVVTAGFASLAVGKLNLISIAFAVLYIGLGIDFAIHYCLRYRELVAVGNARPAALKIAASDVGSSLALCAVTTSVGFFAFIPTNFSGVAQLGLIAGTGMYISLVATLLLLPALILVLPGRAMRPPGATNALRRAGRILNVRRKTVLLLAAVFALTALLSLPNVRFDSDPVNLRDPASESVATFRELTASSGQPAMTLSYVGEKSRIAEATRALAAIETVRSARSIDSFVPLEQREKLILIEELALILGPELARAPATKSTLVAGDLKKLREALRRHANAPRALRLANSIDEFLAVIDGYSDEDRVTGLQRLDDRTTGTLPANFEQLRLALEASEVTAGNLPESLASLWRTPDGRQRLEITPAKDLADAASLSEFVKTVRDVIPGATGLPVVHVEAGAAVARAFVEAFALAIVVVGILMLVLLRRLTDTFRVMTPLVLAMLWTTAIATVAGIPFNFANVIALPLLLGVGVDNGIHLAHRREVAPPVDGNLLGTSTARAIVFSALTTIAGFGNLALSAHPGTASMGQLLTIGMAVVVIATLVVLPALMPVNQSTAET